MIISEYMDLNAIVYSPLDTTGVPEQDEPADELAEEPQPATHFLHPGIRTPQPMDRTVKKESFDGDWSPTQRPTRPHSVAINRIKYETPRSSATPDPVYSPGVTLAKPRKYERKPESVKANLSYQEKRAKNNDAVRRSRAKAKSRASQVRYIFFLHD